MRNILKGLLDAKAYEFPDAEDLRFDTDLPPEEAEEPGEADPGGASPPVEEPEPEPEEDPSPPGGPAPRPGTIL